MRRPRLAAFPAGQPLLSGPSAASRKRVPPRSDLADAARPGLFILHILHVRIISNTQNFVKGALVPPTSSRKGNKKIGSPLGTVGGTERENCLMSVSTSYTDTEWSSYELAHMMGLKSRGRASERLEELDRIVVEFLSIDYVRRSVRADQAANSIRCFVDRLNKMFEADRERTMQHITRLIKIANDKATMRRVEGIVNRLPSPSARTPERKEREIA